MRAHRIVLLALVTALLAPLVPLAGADHGGEHTLCYGGETDLTFTHIAAGYNVRASDGAVWEDTNGNAGVQTTGRTCVTYDSSYKVTHTAYTPADEVVLEGVTLPPGGSLNCVPGMRLCLF